MPFDVQKRICSSSIFRVEPSRSVANSVNSLVMRVPSSHCQPVQFWKCRMNLSTVNPTGFFLVVMVPFARWSLRVGAPSPYYNTAENYVILVMRPFLLCD